MTKLIKKDPALAGVGPVNIKLILDVSESLSEINKLVKTHQKFYR